VYDFAIVALLGLATWKVAGMVFGLLGIDLTSSVRALVTMGLGIVAALTLDYSLFASWDISVSNGDYGTVITGFIIGGLAYVWHNALGLVEAYGRYHRDQAREIESRSTPRAA
jgi:hypothetical protein